MAKAKTQDTKLQKLQEKEEELRANLDAVRKQKLVEEKKSNGVGFVSRAKNIAKGAWSYAKKGLSWLWGKTLKVAGFCLRWVMFGVNLALIALNLAGFLVGTAIRLTYLTIKRGALFIKDKAVELWKHIRPTVMNVIERVKAAALAVYASARTVLNFCYDSAMKAVDAALKLVDFAVGLVVTVTVSVLDVAARVIGQILARGIIAYQEVLRQTGMESGERVPQAAAA